MVKVSVVVPVYNPGKYVQSCINGLLGQTMPAEEFEAIFVDDGSTDETPGVLDAVASEHANIYVIHQENSGWPGKPRNVGIEAAQGEFVFFCDHDDWLGDEALQRMYDYAIANEADVLIGKMAGIGRPVAHHLFSRSRAHATLADSPIMDSLTPHKLFRRSFLYQHHIRFPEGKRRLEDHLFVVTAYLLARNISVYSDYTCYYHIRREDGANAAFTTIDWTGYFDNLREALDVVVEHTEPGALRDRIFKRWLQIEMVQRLTGNRLLRLAEDERNELFQAAHQTAAHYFGVGVVTQLSPVSQAVARHLIAGDLTSLLQIAEYEPRWQAMCTLDQASWSGENLSIAGTAMLGEGSGTDVDFSDRAIRTLIGDVEQAKLDKALMASTCDLYAMNRTSKERWTISRAKHADRLHWDFNADIDVSQLAAGQPLPPGRWDIYLEITAFGIRRRIRLELSSDSTLIDTPIDRDEPLAIHPVAAYYTKGNRGLTIAVGKKFEPPVRKAAAAAATAASAAGPPTVVGDESQLSPAGQTPKSEAPSAPPAQESGAQPTTGLMRIRSPLHRAKRKIAQAAKRRFQKPHKRLRG